MAEMLCSEDDRAACAALLRGGSFSFHAASRLLPASVRDDATALYAFCRVADDAVDGAAAPAERVALLARRLDALCRGRPEDHPADRAFAAVIRRHAIPRDLPAALIEGFAWDAAGRRYRDLGALRAYAARVAGSVGVMMALVMGVRDPASLAAACDLGLAMQFSNIARDVGEDARNGRLYLPLDWLADAGIDPDALLAAPVFTPALFRVVARLLAEAEALYERAAPGIAALPLRCRPGIEAARVIYREIGREVARGALLGRDPLRHRARVGGARKLALALGALPAGLPAPAARLAPWPETRFLVAAAELAQEGRAERFIRLLEKLERLDRMPRKPDMVALSN